LKRNIILSLVLLFVASELVVAEVVNRRVVGLVELPSIFGKYDPNGSPGLVRPANVQAVPIYSHPFHNSPVVGKILELVSVETKEFDYEAPAAVVYGIVDGWVLIHITDSLKNKFGWVSPHERGPFHPLVDLLNSGLCYLEEDWDGVLYESTNTLKDIKRTIKSLPAVQDYRRRKIFLFNLSQYPLIFIQLAPFLVFLSFSLMSRHFRSIGFIVFSYPLFVGT